LQESDLAAFGLIGDCTLQTPSELSARDVLSIRFDSFGAKPGRARVQKTLTHQRIMVIAYSGQKPALILAVPRRMCRTETLMDDIKKPEEQTQAASQELSKEELDKAVGGDNQTPPPPQGVTHEPFSITMRQDAASPKLYE
jgi:hypothetical protein